MNAGACNSHGDEEEEEVDNVNWHDDEDETPVNELAPKNTEVTMNQPASVPEPSHHWSQQGNRRSENPLDGMSIWAHRASHGHGSRNRFFEPPGDGEEPRKGRVYAAIEVPEPENDFTRNQGQEAEPQPVMLECVDTSWFHSMQSNENGLLWTDIYQDAPLSVLELTNYPLPQFPEGAQPGDIAWYEFGYESASSTESDARHYTSLFSDGATVKISFHEPRALGWQGKGPMGSSGWLSQAIAKLPPDFQGLEMLRKKLAAVDCSGGVAIYDVGQGACQAALDDELHLPQMYVDFGGGVLVNRKTFPDELVGFCFTRRPIIVLSHWDWDHWSSAYRQEASMSAPWFAPPVPMKPIQQAFAAELFARKSLHIWDTTWPAEIVGGPVRIERCTGRTINDSGLAVTLRRSAASTRNCLLPGDAAYACIPSVAGGASFNSLCMTHHGGRLHSTVYPKPKRGGSSTLSAGPRNSYKHPLFHTLATHLEVGWKFPIATALTGQRPSHVLVPWGSQPHAFQGGCHGHECSVAIAAVVPKYGTVLKMANANTPRKARTHVNEFDPVSR